MIKYRLGCSAKHEFESWFRSIDDYEAQSRQGLIACPACGSAKTEKLPMAPAIVTGKVAKRAASLPAEPSKSQAKLIESIRAWRQNIVANSEDVGPRFAEEARNIHLGDAEERNIRGEATPEEVKQLVEEEVPFGILPPLPEDQN